MWNLSCLPLFTSTIDLTPLPPPPSSHICISSIITTAVEHNWAILHNTLHLSQFITVHTSFFRKKCTVDSRTIVGGMSGTFQGVLGDRVWKCCNGQHGLKILRQTISKALTRNRNYQENCKNLQEWKTACSITKSCKINQFLLKSNSDI